MLRQFGVMGSVYMERIMGVKNPRVGVVNIGTEDSKGTDLQVEANRLLKNAGVNYGLLALGYFLLCFPLSRLARRLEGTTR